MTRRLIIAAVILLAGLATAWALLAPKTLDVTALAGLEGDTSRGERVFWAAGCAACHAAPKAPDEDRTILAGGRAFASPFGTFYAPNISPDMINGIGLWSELDLVNTLLLGTGPEGQHYYPVLPYGSYRRMTLQDVVDLHSYMEGLPVISTPNKAHDLQFPYSLRASLGGWKLLFARGTPPAPQGLSAEEERGRYLVEVLGHCGECHTPRSALGGLDYDRWLAGGPNPAGTGKIPNITPAELTWSKTELVEYFTSGFTPEFDVVGGEMVEVVKNLAQLPKSDRAAIAAYLKRVPAVR